MDNGPWRSVLCSETGPHTITAAQALSWMDYPHPIAISHIGDYCLVLLFLSCILSQDQASLPPPWVLCTSSSVV